MKKTGEILKTAREQRGLSITEVSLSTKISAKVLQAMEEGDRERLPALTFLRGFLKSYAQHLHLDVEMVMATFADETGSQAVAAPTPLPEPEIHVKVKSSTPESSGPKALGRNSGFKPNTRIIFSGIGVVLLLIAVISVQKIYNKYQSERELGPVPSEIVYGPKNETKAEPTEKIPVEEKTPEAKTASTDKGTTTESPASNTEKSDQTNPVSVKTAEEKIEVKPSEPKVEPKPDQTKLADVKPVETKPAEEKVQEQKTPEPAAVVAKPEAAKPSEEASAPAAEKPTPAARPEEIILEALDKVEVSFKINDGKSERLTLLPDQIHTIKLKGKVALEFSDGGAINIIHNGKDRGVPGDLGKPKSVTIP